MNCLLISDLHLTDVPRDAYRWKLFTWLEENLDRLQVSVLFILGDLCEAKDRHSAVLVNRIVESLAGVYRNTNCHKIYILRGNHDGLDPRCAYFRFLGQYPWITFIETPFTTEFAGQQICLLPHTVDPVQAWDSVDLHTADLVFMHQTISGAVAENGMALEGLSTAFLTARAPRATIYSGDVHVPQRAGRVTYVGAPYPIRFGDSFQPRTILLERFRKEVSIDLSFMRRPVISVSANDFEEQLADIREDDQVKVRLKLSQAEFCDWQQLKGQVVEKVQQSGAELCGLELEQVEVRKKIVRGKQEALQQIRKSPFEIFTHHCTVAKLDERMTAVGDDILRQATAV